MQHGIAGLLALMLLWAGAARAETYRHYRGDYTYTDASRLYTQYYRNGFQDTRPFEDGDDPAAQGHPGLWLRDCSTAEHRCVAMNYNLLAVPRGELATGDTYRVENTFFTILKCTENMPHMLAYTPERKPKCESALIKADCQWLYLGEEKKNGCYTVEGGRQESPHPGPIFYFLYHERHGVTAYGGSWYEEVNPLIRRAIIDTFLIGERGFLAPE